MLATTMALATVTSRCLTEAPLTYLTLVLAVYSSASASEIQAFTTFTSVFTADRASHLPAPLLPLHSRPELATQLIDLLIDASEHEGWGPDALLLLCLRGRLGNEMNSSLTYLCDLGLICYLLGLVLAWCALELVEHESFLSVFAGSLVWNSSIVGVRRQPWSCCSVLRDWRWEGGNRFYSYHENKETMYSIKHRQSNTIIHSAECSMESTKHQHYALVYAGLGYPALGQMQSRRDASN